MLTRIPLGARCTLALDVLHTASKDQMAARFLRMRPCGVGTLALKHGKQTTLFLRHSGSLSSRLGS